MGDGKVFTVHDQEECTIMQKLDQRAKKRGKKRLITIKNTHPAMRGPDAQ